MNPFEQFLQQILGRAQQPAPRDATMTPPMPQQAPTPAIYELFNTMPDIAKVLSAGPGFLNAQDPYGNTFRAEGAIPWRLNNPGNLEFGDFAKSQGAVPDSPRFAAFPTRKAGIKALRNKLFVDFKDRTIADLMESYAPRHENNTDKYIAFLMSRVKNAGPIKDFTKSQREALVNGIIEMEGSGEGGKVTMGGKTWKSKPQGER